MKVIRGARVVVVGTRTFDDYDLLNEKLQTYCALMEEFEVVTGGAKGADALAERWAFVNWRMAPVVKIFHPDWEKHGKGAGPIRNQEMVDYAAAEGNGYFVAFWDGRSAGTKDAITKAKKAGLKVRVVYYEEE